MRRKTNQRKYHGGPEVRIGNPKHSRGLGGWHKGEKSGKVKIIVQAGIVLDPSRYEQYSLTPGAESLVTASRPLSSGGTQTNVNPVPPSLRESSSAGEDSAVA